jgi:hypothetical protein
MNFYRSKEWKLFRKELLRLEDERCTRCFLGRDDGVVLHIHHKFYVFGRKPWQYRYEDCEVLCQSCHAQEHGIIPPKTDWEFVGYDDLGAPDGHCDYCGTQIRHVFMVQHEKWITLEVGEICCDSLTSTNLATDHMKGRRRLLERKKRFTSRWGADARGPYIRYGDILVRIVPADMTFKLWMNGRLGKQIFKTALDAKIRAFEVLESGAAARYLQNQNIERT